MTGAEFLLLALGVGMVAAEGWVRFGAWQYRRRRRKHADKLTLTANDNAPGLPAKRRGF